MELKFGSVQRNMLGEDKVIQALIGVIVENPHQSLIQSANYNVFSKSGRKYLKLRNERLVRDAHRNVGFVRTDRRHRIPYSFVRLGFHSTALYCSCNPRDVSIPPSMHGKRCSNPFAQIVHDVALSLAAIGLHSLLPMITVETSP